jgi:hypothetical protein
MYQFVVESLLGVQRSGNRLCLRPLLPRQWTTFDIQCHFGASRHDISCRAEAGLAASVVHNGIEADSGSIRLVDDSQVHVIVVNLGDRSFINPSARKPDGAAVEAALKKHKKLKLIYELGSDLTGFAAGAMWDDMKLGIAHLNAWERVAVVTDVDWVSNATNLFKFVMPCPVKVFSFKDRAAAEKWIAA